MRTAKLLLTGLALLLTGCASNAPAPVFDRAPPQEAEKPTGIDVKPGYYLVKKGDTLRSIALDHGQDYKDIAAWNNLDNPNLIRVDQQLRVIPPEGEAAVETHAVVPPVQIESRPVDSRPAAVDTVKREPKGGVQLYSDAAWAQIQTPQNSQNPALNPSTATAPAAPAKPVVATALEIDWGWPSSQKISTPYSDGGSKGLDFEGKLGEPVQAAASGKVTLVTSSLRGYGNLIVVKHNTAYLSVYAHNSKMLVTEGQTVSKGQKIAEIGSTDTDRPNLHFEIRREGKPVDPAKYLPQR